MLYNTIFPAKYMNFDMQGVHLDLSICDTSYLHLLHQKNSCRGSRRPALRRKPTDSCGSGSVACGRRCCLHPCSWWTWHRGSACPCLQPGRSERMLWCWDCGRWAEFRVQSALKHHLKCGFVLGSSAGERSASTDLPGVCSISVRSAQWSCRLSSSYLISNTCRRGEEAEPSTVSCILLSQSEWIRCGSVLQCSSRRMSFTQRYCKCVCVAIRNLSIACPDCPHASHPQFTC